MKKMKMRATTLFVVWALLATVVLAAPPSAEAQVETFVDGTQLEVLITSPEDGATTVGGSIDVAGTARIGGGNPSADTVVVAVVDLSFSTWAASGGDCGGDLEGDGRFDSIFDCQVAAVEALEQTAASLGTVAEFGVVPFAGIAAAADVNPAPGIQVLTVPGSDLNDNGQTDISEVLRSAVITDRLSTESRVLLHTERFVSGGTNFAAGFTSACDTLAASSQPNRTLILLSDGGASSGANVNNLSCGNPVNVFAFAVGSGSSCDFDPTGRGSLNDLVSGSDGECFAIVEPDTLPAVLNQLIAPELTQLTYTVNGGPSVDITAQATPALPSQGPVTVDWATTIDDLSGSDNEICITASGTNNGEQQTSTECVTVGGNNPPVALAGDDQIVSEGALVTLDGSASLDPDGDPLTYSWEVTASTGQPPVVSASTEPTLSFLAFDDAAYEFTLTVSDGRSSAADTVSVTVENAAPVLTAAAEPATAGGVSVLTASFTDEGLLDTHTATIDWGDGTLTETVPVSGQGNGWGTLFGSHVYADTGSYTATVTVTDDDGATATAQSVSITAVAPLAIWADGSDGIDWTGGGGTVTGLTHSNGGIRTRGQAKTFDGPVEYVTSFDVKKTTTTEPEQQVSVAPAPVVFDIADYAPGGRAAIDAGADYFDMSNECGNRWDPSGPLTPGLYYVPCDVKLNSSALGGEVTIVSSDDIQVSGSSANFAPFIDGLLFLSGSSGNKAIQISSSGGTFFGFLNAPAGRIDVSGSGNTYLCGMVADRIDISDGGIEIAAVDCVRPDNTVAPPSLIPNLETALTVSPETVIPGDTLTTTVTATNGGAVLFVPGVVGIENLGDEPVTINDVTVGLEYLPVGGSWTPIAEAVTVDAIANANPSVTYGDPFANTWVGVGGLASWGVQLEATLDASTVAFLLDETQVAGVRNTFDVDLFNPTGEPVRRLFRYGNDFSDALRALSGDLTDSTVFVSLPDGTTQIVDAVADPALALLAPGETASIELTTTVPVPAPRGDDEPSQAYIDRLLGLNDTLLTGSAYAVSTGGVGSVLGGFTFGQATRVLPVVTKTLDGPAALVAGDVDQFDISWTNAGSATAASVDATATVDNEAAVITGVPTQLVAGEIAPGGAFDIAIDAEAPIGLVAVDSATNWTDANGNVYGDITADAIVEIASAPDLIAMMADSVVVDADGSGVPSIGDTIGYSVTITNRGATPADDVVFDVFLDTNSTLGVAPVTTSQGTAGGAGNNVIVDVGTLAPMSSAEITFEAVVNGGTSLTAQGTVTSSDTDPVLTDDPGFLGAFDPTVTTLVVSEPDLVVSMGGRLGVDPDGDGGTTDDTFVYELLVSNSGLTTANGVQVTVPIDPNTTLVPGSVEVLASGVVVTGNAEGDTEVVVDLGALPSFNRAEITFQVTVNEGLPDGETEISAQASATFDEDPAPVLSDDPALPGTEDPTVFTVTTTTTPGGGGGGDGEDPPGDTGPGNTWGDDASFGTVTPTSNQIVTEPIAVTADITPPEDTEIESWKVIAFPAGGDPATGLVLDEGTGTPPPTLATFDPTVLSNGVWTIRIEATDDDAGMGVHEVNVVVEGQLKLGRFSTTWLDSSVAVSGIPVRVLRTYDTIERYGFDDYGYGWTLDVANFEVATNRPLYEAGYQGQGCGGGLIFTAICYVPDTPRIVNVTWPDGRVDSFALQAKGNTFITGLAIIDYVPLPGTNSKLFPAAGDDSAGVNAFGQLTDSLFAPNDLYDPTQFVLEAIDGTRYLIDVDAGLLQATDLNNNTVTFSDAGIISSQGQSLTFTRDEQGRILSVTEPDGSTVNYAYDGAGDLATVVDQNGVSANFTYDSGHFLTNIDDVSAGAFQAIGYDADGRVSTITDRSGNTTSVSTDVGGRTTLVTSPDGGLTTLTTADERGNIVRSEAVYDGGSSTSTISYNDDDLPTSFTDAVGGTWSFTYDGDQNLTSMTDANGVTETYSYDAQGRVTSRTDRLGGTSIFSYDSAGNLTSMTDGAGRTESFGYDGSGSQISRTDGSGGSWSRGVDGAGRTTSVTDPNGNTTSMTLDSNGRLVSRSWPDGGSESFAYDSEGNLTSHSDQLGRTTSFAYDSADRLVQRTDPAGSSHAWSYDPNGRVISESNANGESTSFTWAFDRMTTRFAPDGGITTYSYDGASRLLSMTDPLGRSTSYGYDAAGRRTSVTTPVGTSSMSFDGNGFLTSRSNANGELTTYGLNPIGQITAMTDPVGRSTSYTYDTVGQRTAMTDSLGTTGRGPMTAPDASPPKPSPTAAHTATSMTLPGT